MAPEQSSSAPKFVEATRIKRLTPATTDIFEGTFSLLHAAVKGDTLYRGVFAVLLFPITHPNKYVSLRYTAEDEKVIEIGVIEELEDFPQEQRDLILENLGKHYHEQMILRVHEVKYEHGFLFFDVDTQRGRENFIMPWKHDRAEAFGATGKVLLDALDNRYIIRDVNALPPADRRRFTSYIYW